MLKRSIYLLPLYLRRATVDSRATIGPHSKARISRSHPYFQINKIHWCPCHALRYSSCPRRLAPVYATLRRSYRHCIPPIHTPLTNARNSSMEVRVTFDTVKMHILMRQPSDTMYVILIHCPLVNASSDFLCRVYHTCRTYVRACVRVSAVYRTRSEPHQLRACTRG